MAFTAYSLELKREGQHTFQKHGLTGKHAYFRENAAVKG
jgi:hypothetical protein